MMKMEFSKLFARLSKIDLKIAKKSIFLKILLLKKMTILLNHLYSYYLILLFKQREMNRVRKITEKEKDKSKLCKGKHVPLKLF